MEKLTRENCNIEVGFVFKSKNKEYELKGKIGDGAVGLVRKAIDKKTGKTVAVKFFAPDPKYIDIEAFEDVARRFKREGIRGAKLEHENLVKIIAYEENENGSCFSKGSVMNPFIIMEYVQGKTLESLIKKPSRPDQPYLTQQNLLIAIEVTKAIKYLHDRKITHRDIKPANVFLSSNQLGIIPNIVKLGDFGVTKWGDFITTLTSGTLTALNQQGLGTLKYMSPEQAVKPKEVTVRSDMFSLGITLYELFTGKVLPSAHHVFEIMNARMSRDAISGKLYSLGIKCTPTEEDLFSIILDMFMRGATGRPTSSKFLGNMEFYYEKLFEEPE
ncbi:MAG: hypothetical protein CMD96_06305 [Gammaproteobacteria bacterium]|nr:hypothetical protein [Gammaproteobacteria bacterium]HJP18101.1 serine/threonine-protein kinase [Nitrospinota bacterium]|tara:strand:+ start:3763 stop:4752 length:990 start_codon:yes stop_codon:yes gene_type:complete